MKSFFSIADIKSACKGTLTDTLGIEFLSCEDELLIAEMTIEKKHLQPMGILHGGASAALAETAGSALSILSSKPSEISVGYHLSIHHLMQMKEGKITASAKFLKKGKRIHLISILITDPEQELVAVAQLQCQILPQK